MEEQKAIPPYMDYDVRTEETMEEIKIDIPKGYEFAGVDDDKQQVVFTKIGYNYPKTYEECCKGLGFEEMNRFRPFIQLLRCRDAYWKIADWKPTKDDDGETFSLFYNRSSDKIDKCDGLYETNAILDFPTEEMRDAFYVNFKELIYQCKELL